MIVAVVYGNNISINEYPELKDIEEIRDNFLPDTVLIELVERPEEKEGYQLKYNGSEFYYEEIAESEQPETQLDRIEAAVNDIAKNNTSYAEMAQAIAEGVNDIE